MGQPCRGGRYPSLCAVSSPSTSARTSRGIPDVLTGAIKTHCRNGPNTGSGRWHHIVLCPSRRDAHMAASPVPLATASCPSSIPAMDCYMLTADAARVGCRSGRVKTDLGLTARSRSRWRQAACCLLLEVSGVGHWFHVGSCSAVCVVMVARGLVDSESEWDGQSVAWTREAFGGALGADQSSADKPALVEDLTPQSSECSRFKAAVPYSARGRCSPA